MNKYKSKKKKNLHHKGRKNILVSLHITFNKKMTFLGDEHAYTCF